MERYTIPAGARPVLARMSLRSHNFPGGGGGNEAVEAFDAKVTFRVTRERAGRNASEQPMRPRNW